MHIELNVLLRSSRFAARSIAALQLANLGYQGMARATPLMLPYLGCRGLPRVSPLVRSISTGMLLVGTADVLSQRIEAPNATWDAKRTMRFIAWGALFNGCVFHIWYQTQLPRLMAALANTGPVRSFPTASKILIDQLTLSPLLYVLFPVFHGLAEGKDLAKVQEKTGDMWWKIAAADWTFYPAVQAINFRFLPASCCTLFVQSSSFMFNVGMSFLNKSN